MKPFVLLLSLVLAASPSLAEDESRVVKTFLDGGIEVEGQYFGSQLEFQQSELFQEGGYRCASHAPLRLMREKHASYCTMSSTTISSHHNPGSGGVYKIPVVFHVVQRTDGVGNVSTSLIQSQLAIMNEDFRALSGSLGANGIDTKIEFVLADVKPNGFPTTGIERYTNNAYFTDPGPNVYNDMKDALNWDTTRYLNIYTNDAAGYLGYATFPQQDAGQYEDGVVLLHSAVGRNAPGGGIYDQGRTATHEIGHYFGLFHTFQGGCGSSSAPYTTGDLIADTNRQQSANYNCPSSASSCSSSDPIENYMNYTQDTCMEEFTAQQANRMRCSIDGYRASLPTTKLPAPTGFTMTFDGDEEHCTHWDPVPGAEGYWLHTDTYQPYRILSGTSYCRELKPKYIRWNVSISAYNSIEGHRTPVKDYCDFHPSDPVC